VRTYRFGHILALHQRELSVQIFVACLRAAVLLAPAEQEQFYITLPDGSPRCSFLLSQKRVQDIQMVSHSSVGTMTQRQQKPIHWVKF
jgi:hypothetical protein